MNKKDSGMCYPYAVYIAAGKKLNAIPSHISKEAIAIFQFEQSGRTVDDQRIIDFKASVISAAGFDLANTVYVDPDDNQLPHLLSEAARKHQGIVFHARTEHGDHSFVAVPGADGRFTVLENSGREFFSGPVTAEDIVRLNGHPYIPLFGVEILSR